MFALSDLEQLEYRYLLEDIIELQKQVSPICSEDVATQALIVGGTFLVARGKINRQKLVRPGSFRGDMDQGQGNGVC